MFTYSPFVELLTESLRIIGIKLLAQQSLETEVDKTKVHSLACSGAFSGIMRF